ncbi:hypothetical protein AGMMS49944_23810 [Spirochaetia bacterium]|nr:hypothetical protein AGMMS49944_23810 [Spirochaetia bacterium]
MSLNFTVKDVVHKITVKFVHSFLPEAKKAYHLKTVFQPELDIHGVASKGEIYNIGVSPKVIVEGMTAGMELIHYLAADGYKIKTPVFNLKMGVGGEYDGGETHLNEGVYPEARLQVAGSLRRYLKERVQVAFDGIDNVDGYIANAVDELTAATEQTVTIDNLLSVHGYGLKIDGDEAHRGDTGLFFITPEGEHRAAKAVAVNENRTLTVIAPMDLVPGTEYQLLIVTQSSSKGGGALLKNLREVRSDFTLFAQTAA